MKFSFKLLEKVKNQAGVSAVIIAIVLPMLIAFGALGIDVGYMYVNRNELQNVADASALAAARKLGAIYQGMPYSEQYAYVCDDGVDDGSNNDIAVIKGVANAVAHNNKAGGMHMIVYGITEGGINIDNVEIGVWDPDNIPPLSEDFTNYNQPDAVRVKVRSSDNANSRSISTWFANIFGIDTVNVSAYATAALTGPAMVGEGELKVPLSLSENNFPNDCTNPITFSPTADSCAAWHNFFDKDDASSIGDKLIDLIQSDDEQDYSVFDENGEPVLEWQPVFDENGESVLDENGELVLEWKPKKLVNGPAWLAANFNIDKTPDDDVITPQVEIGDEFNHLGGTASTLFLGGRLGNIENDINLATEILDNIKKPAPFPALFDYFRRRDDDGNDSIWTSTIPVYDDNEVCINPSGGIPLLGFATIEIHMPKPPPDSFVEVYVYCELNFIDGRGGGGTFGNIKGTIPNLVE